MFQNILKNFINIFGEENQWYVFISSNATVQSKARQFHGKSVMHFNKITKRQMLCIPINKWTVVQRKCI